MHQHRVMHSFPSGKVKPDKHLKKLYHALIYAFKAKANHRFSCIQTCIHSKTNHKLNFFLKLISWSSDTRTSAKLSLDSKFWYVDPLLKQGHIWFWHMIPCRSKVLAILYFSTPCRSKVTAILYFSTPCRSKVITLLWYVDPLQKQGHIWFWHLIPCKSKVSAILYFSTPCRSKVTTLLWYVDPL